MISDLSSYFRADELLLTEMIFNGLFNDLSPQKCAALLSCFVFEEKAEMPKLAEELSGILRQMQVRLSKLLFDLYNLRRYDFRKWQGKSPLSQLRQSCLWMKKNMWKVSSRI